MNKYVSGLSMQFESIPQWVKNPPSPETQNDPRLCENRDWKIHMTINCAVVGLFVSIGWIAEVIKHWHAKPEVEGSSPVQGNFFQFFFAFIF